MNVHVSLRQLRVFRALAEGRNFSQAGAHIGLTQPAVSRAVSELERQVGVMLFDRTTREVALTAAGQSLAARLARVLDELDQTLQDVAGLASAEGGRVRVASSPTLSANLMPACIAACAREAPGIELVLLDRVQEDVLESVRRGEVDFGVVVEPAPSHELEGEPILRDPFVLVVPAAHALAGRRSVRWAALDGLPLVLLDHSSGSRRLIDAALAAHAARIELRQELGHPTTVFRMVEAGIGLAVMPALAWAPQESERLACVPLVPRQERAIMLVRRRRRALAPVAERVWQLVRRTAAAR